MTRRQSFEYELEGPPITWKRVNYFYGRGVTPKEQREAKQLHQWKAVNAARGWDKTGEFGLEVQVFVKDRRRCDADNFLKLVADSLIGVAYEDDSQVTVMTVSKRLDRERPRTFVRVVREPLVTDER